MHSFPARLEAERNAPAPGRVLLETARKDSGFHWVRPGRFSFYFYFCFSWSFLLGLLLGLDLPDGVDMAQVDPALFVDVGDLDPDHITHVHGVLNPADPVIRQLGDVDHAVLAGSQLHKGAELQNAHHLTVV